MERDEIKKKLKERKTNKKKRTTIKKINRTTLNFD